MIMCNLREVVPLKNRFFGHWYWESYTASVYINIPLGSQV